MRHLEPRGGFALFDFWGSLGEFSVQTLKFDGYYYM